MRATVFSFKNEIVIDYWLTNSRIDFATLTETVLTTPETT